MYRYLSPPIPSNPTTGGLRISPWLVALRLIGFLHRRSISMVICIPTHRKRTQIQSLSHWSSIKRSMLTVLHSGKQCDLCALLPFGFKKRRKHIQPNFIISRHTVCQGITSEWRDSSRLSDICGWWATPMHTSSFRRYGTTYKRIKCRDVSVSWEIRYGPADTEAKPFIECFEENILFEHFAPYSTNKV